MAFSLELPAYAELHCLSNFTFLRGASHPEELVARACALGYSALALTDECSLAGNVRAHVAAKALGYAALALTDECSLAGAVRAHVAAKERSLKLILGTEILVEKQKIVLLATNRRSYGAISSLITAGRRRSKKGAYSLSRTDVEALSAT
ncbi:MAG: PHP domain-containing protein, partial [Burkholderiales bacterium]